MTTVQLACPAEEQSAIIPMGCRLRKIAWRR